MVAAAMGGSADAASGQRKRPNAPLLDAEHPIGRLAFPGSAACYIRPVVTSSGDKRFRVQSGTSPFLMEVSASAEEVASSAYAFAIPALSGGIALKLSAPVTFFVGENGSGKSTLLEAIAACCGFNKFGGNRNHGY